jgi:hypothetical protein
VVEKISDEEERVKGKERQSGMNQEVENDMLYSV